MSLATGWQEATIQRLHDLLFPLPAVEALAIVGSGASGTSDAWSDVDALVVVRPEALGDFFPTLAWLEPLGAIFAYEQHRDELRPVSRVAFEDMRRLDAIVTTPDALQQDAVRSSLPLTQGIKVIFARSAELEHLLVRPAVELLLVLPPDDEFEALANQFWYQATVAVQKVVRGDLLVALHLGLDLVRDCCVVAMLLRDRETGTNRHRGGVGNEAVAELDATRRPYDAPGILDGIEQSAIAFDRLATRWSASYGERRRPLLSLIADARRSVSDASGALRSARARPEPTRTRPPSADPVEPTPALWPARVVHEGRYVRLEPLDARVHTDELYAASHGDESALRIWDYLSYGPFPTVEAFGAWLRECSSTADPLFLALRDKRTGRAAGVASFMNVVPKQGTIEIGHIWFGPALQNTPAATEGLYLMIRHALDELGYRRMEWKCNGLNQGSRNAAVRLGFAFEGLFYQHMISRGRNRDTAWFSILDGEWPAIRANFETWLAPENFDAAGRQRTSLAELNRFVR
jgi:RimJ/RimL family protein N-acetyltransferase